MKRSLENYRIDLKTKQYGNIILNKIFPFLKRKNLQNLMNKVRKIYQYSKKGFAYFFLANFLTHYMILNIIQKLNNPTMILDRSIFMQLKYYKNQEFKEI